MLIDYRKSPLRYDRMAITSAVAEPLERFQRLPQLADRIPSL